MSKKQTVERGKVETFISKYHLGGLIDSVAWTYDGKKLSTRFVNEQRTLLGNLSWSGFEHSEDFEIGIFSTAKLSKMLSVLNSDISLKVTKVDDEAKTLEISDDSVSVKYVLSKLDVLPQAPTKTKIPDFDVSLVIDTEFIERFIKACSALPEVGTFAVDVKKDGATITLGYTSVQSNCIVFNAKVENAKPIDRIVFPTPLFREVFSANKAANKTVLEISSQGISKLDFKEDDYHGTYYIVASEEA